MLRRLAKAGTAVVRCAMVRRPVAAPAWGVSRPALLSTADGPPAGMNEPVDRGNYPAYVPLLAMRPDGGPPALTVDQAIAINETVNSVLEYGLFTNQRFRDLKALPVNAAVKFQLLMETLVEVQLYAALPYGFESSPKGYQDFTMALGQVGQQLTDPNSEDAEELKQVFEETWEIALKEVFGVVPESRLTLAQAQVVSAKLSASMQDEAFLDKIAADVAPLPAEQRQLAIEELSYEQYLPIMAQYGFEGAGGFAQLKVELTKSMGDPQVQMNLMALQRAVSTKAALMV